MSLEAMFYALENGTGATGTFTLDTALPNTETLIIDSGLDEIHGVMFLAKGYFQELNESTNVQTTGLGIAVYSEETLVRGLLTLRNHNTAYIKSSTGEAQEPVTQGTIRVDGGSVYCTANFNQNANYTPFEPGIEYRWIVW